MGDKYNGWTNYETWAVNLWLTNDEGTDTYWREVTQEVWAEEDWTNQDNHSRAARHTLSERLKDEVTDSCSAHVETPTLAFDLLSAALGSVEWFEIVDNWLRDDCEGYQPTARYDEGKVS